MTAERDDGRERKHGPSLRTKLLQTSKATMRVNGREVIVADYMANPSYYNSLPMDEEFVKEIHEEHEKNVETKKKYQQLSAYDVPDIK